MAEKDKFYPEFDDENQDRDKGIKDDLGAERAVDNLTFNEDEDSFEIDVESEDPDYQHPDPYDTAVKSGSDDNSDYDEANPTAVDEYRRADGQEAESILSNEFGMHIDRGDIVELSPEDEYLARTEEDERGDLDEEGYPKKD